ncbi:MAG: 6-phosphogluconolactonase [Planctomycetota bacterium]|jgi:6-phosphogluconolactonase|nr:6-phosphogluconolactonase [Planctomycetota bacterium]
MLPYTPSIVAEHILTVLDQAAVEQGRCSLAIPGGRSPGAVLTELARICSPFVRERLHLLWVDERAVPLGHADRNDAATLAAWEAGGPLPAHVHAMPAELDDLDAAALAYAAVLDTATAGEDLDVVLVGIGEDGHIASLFPDHAGLDELSPVFAITDSPKPPPRRLSLSLGVLRAARSKIVLALGAAKGAVLAEARRGPSRQLPVSLLGMDLVWYCDDAATAAVRATE